MLIISKYVYKKTNFTKHSNLQSLADGPTCFIVFVGMVNCPVIKYLLIFSVILFARNLAKSRTHLEKVNFAKQLLKANYYTT